MKTKRYLSIKEVSKLLDIKEHVIRYWDSIDPSTNKLRIEYDWLFIFFRKCLKVACLKT